MQTRSSTKYSNGTAIKVEWMFTNTMIQLIPLKLKLNCLAKQESTLIYLNNDKWKEESLFYCLFMEIGRRSNFLCIVICAVVAGQLLKWRK